jgi:hypothetical protein
MAQKRNQKQVQSNVIDYPNLHLDIQVNVTMAARPLLMIVAQ